MEIKALYLYLAIAKANRMSNVIVIERTGEDSMGYKRL